MKSNGKGHQIRTSGSRGERGRGRIARTERAEGVKRIELQKRESGTERTSRNKTVISRHFTHERERLADSTCVPVLGTLLPTVKRSSSSSSLSHYCPLSFRLHARSFIPLYFSPLLHRLFLSRSAIPLSPLHPRLAEKYCSR